MTERKLLFLLGAVQFINVLEFMMVIPLGPELAAGLGISSARLGIVAGSYTAAAAVSGLVGALFLDRFDRRKALFVAIVGLVAGTACAGLAQGLGGLVLARVIAGVFGGPASSIAMAIVADQVPPERRGKALGAVAGAFALASVLGVPASIRMAMLGGWRLPFFVVAGMGIVVASGAIALMPPMRKHLEGPGAAARAASRRPLRAFLADPTVLLALASMGVFMIGTFALVSNLFAFLRFNIGYPGEHVDWLYMAGGLVSFFAMRAAGVVIDRRGSVAVATAATAMAVVGIGLLVLPERPWLPVMILFVMIMVANALRIVSLNALTSRVPAPQERARYMSSQSAIQHIATSLGAMGSTLVLHERSDKSLVGMGRLAVFAIVLALVFPVLLAQVAARVRRRDLGGSAITPAA